MFDYKISKFLIQAGLTSLEVKFEEWQWEEELKVFTLEEVGLGISEVIRQKLFSSIFFLALIINIVGLGISTIVFVIEILVKLLKK